MKRDDGRLALSNLKRSVSAAVRMRPVNCVIVSAGSLSFTLIDRDLRQDRVAARR